MRTILQLLLALSCVCIDMHSNQSGELPTLISKAKDAVVVIQTDHGLGSGFVVRPNGLIITNHHVIANSSHILITFPSGEVYDKAFVLAEDQAKDLALLRVEGAGLLSLPLAGSAEYEIGTEVVLIGAPKGLSSSVSTGIISAIRVLKNGTKVLQTTAPSSPGCSGGPLLSRDGRVVGVITFQISDGQNINFAIPSSYIAGMLETIEKFSAGQPLRTLTRLPHDGLSLSSQDPAENTRQGHRGALFLAVRTVNHQNYSSREVFQQIVDDIMLFLKQRNLQLLNDSLGASFQIEGTISVYEVLVAAKKAGAPYVIILTVDRPLSKWVKLRCQCFGVDGNVVWDEKTEEGGGFKSTRAVMAAIEKLKASISKYVESLADR